MRGRDSPDRPAPSTQAGGRDAREATGRQALERLVFMALTRNRHIGRKNLLRSPARRRKHRLTEADGTRKRGSEATASATQIAATLSGGKAVVALRMVSVLFVLCPRSLTSLCNEGICGRFGRIGV
jgi:hypothetical protein